MDTLAARLERRAAERPDHVAVLEDRHAVTYGALTDRVAALAGDLRARGVGRGTPVALAFPNGEAFVRAFFALARLGALAVPLNPAFRPGEIAALLGDLRVPLVLAAPELAERCRAGADQAGGAAVLVGPEPAARAAAGDPGPGPAPMDAVLALYSSGSTGRPKRVERTHAQLLFETDRLVHATRMGPADRVLGAAPFSHVNGLVRSMVASLVSGATLVPVRRFERRTVGQLIEAHRVSVFIAVPFMFATLAETRWSRPVDLGSLRLCVSGSAPLRREAERAFHARYGVHVRQLYGTTETGTIAVNLEDPPDEALDSVGTPLPGVAVEVLGEDGRPLPPGETGELAIRSPAATRAYPERPEETARAFRDGWFLPGDVGRRDARGRIYLVGRKSLFINRGGFKVNPYEVEELLERHPRVREAAVVGVETEYGDQRVKAVLVTTGPCTEAEIVEFCRDRIADFKVPSVVEFRPELPKSTAGKLLRTALVEAR